MYVRKLIGGLSANQRKSCQHHPSHTFLDIFLSVVKNLTTGKILLIITIKLDTFLSQEWMLFKQQTIKMGLSKEDLL